MVDHAHQLTQLYQLVVGQQREIVALQGELRRAFASTWQQLETVQRNMAEEQRRVLAEHSREQRILLMPHHSLCLLHRVAYRGGGGALGFPPSSLSSPPPPQN